MNSPPFRLAIIGAEGVSHAYSAAVLEHRAALELAAVVDAPGPGRDKLATDHGAGTFEKVEDFLSARSTGAVRADGAVICTPPSMHARAVEACLQAGLHMLVERPLANTLAETRRLVETAARFPKLSSHVAMGYRAAPVAFELLGHIRSGKIGRVLRYECSLGTFAPSLRERWMSDPAIFGGGVLMDLGWVALDMFRVLIGPGRVVGCVRDHAWAGKGETTATVLLRATGELAGVAGVVTCGWLENDRFKLRVIGTDGSLEHDFLRPSELVLAPATDAPVIIPVGTHEARFAKQLLALAAAAAGRSVQTDVVVPPAKFADALEIAELIEAAYRFER